MEDSTEARNRAGLLRNMGPLVAGALADPTTTDIALNPDGSVWLEKLGSPMHAIGRLEPGPALAFIRTVATLAGTEINASRPLLECVLPYDGSRFAAQVPPVVRSPAFTIRKHATHTFTLAKLVEMGSLSRQHCSLIESAVANHQNILVAGGTGAGKTAVLNAIVQAIVVACPDERIVIIEDTTEIQCSAANAVPYETSSEAGVGMDKLLRTALRMRPDRILVGETRGPEALDLLDSWNTGHCGAATIHANTAADALLRLESQMSRNPFAPRAIEPLIGRLVHLIVNSVRAGTRRYVRELVTVSGYESGRYQFQTHPREDF